MGNRASFEFRQGGESSPVFCDHWGGIELFTYVRNYLWLRCEMRLEESARNDPLFRLEPMHLMVDFIVWYSREQNHQSCYIAKDKMDVDNSDCGHMIVDTDEFLREFMARVKPKT